MLLHLLTIEIRKTIRHPGLWIGLGMLAFTLALATLLQHAQTARSYQASTGGLEQDLLEGLSLYNWIGVFVYAIAASVIVAFDYPDRSIQLWLSRGTPRWLLLCARLLTILIIGLLLVSATILLILGLAVISRLVFFGQVDSLRLNWMAILPTILRVFLSGLPYLALTLLLAVVSRSPLFAAGGTIVFGAVVEPLALSLGERYPNIVQFLPRFLAQIIQFDNLSLDRTAPASILPAGLMTIPQAALSIAGIFVLLGMLSIIIFSRQDLGG
jgi:ABC-type transport system involved in multi-copper enzyme maturation permease subunit